MTQRPIFDGWQSYCREVLPVSTTPEEVEQYRMVFFAGAQVALSAAFPGNDADAVREGAMNTRDMIKELAEFNATLRHGNA